MRTPLNKPSRATTRESFTGRLSAIYLNSKFTAMNFFSRLGERISLFLFGPNKHRCDELEAAQQFQDVLREATLYQQPMLVTIRAGGWESTVAVAPSDQLVDFLFQWSQRAIFRIGTDCMDLPVEMPADFDGTDERRLRRYMRAWADIMVENGTFPVMLVTRREPDRQAIIATPGYTEEQLLEILDRAKLLVPDILTHIKFTR